MARPVTSELIARAGAALAEDGWRYTRRQLYYATCAAAETPPRSPARGQFALGALLALVALILLPFRPAALALGILAALSMALGLITQRTHRPVRGRLLAVSYAEFEALLATLESLPGLVAASDEPVRVPAPPAGILVCDTDENAAAVSANLARAELTDVAVCTLDTVPPRTAAAVALHDASPRGCALPAELADSGMRVFDAGLRPAWVDGERVQMLEGAPARLPRDLSMVLSEDELAWLRSGRRVELAVLPAPRLMALVRESLTRAAAIDGTAESTPRITSAPALPGAQLLGSA